MKTINDFTFEQQKQIVFANKDLKDKFEYYLQQCEMDYLSDKLDCVKNSLSDWCIEFWGRRPSMDVKDYYSFCLGVEKSGKSYGLSDRLTKLLERCFKLYLSKSNLFEYYAEKLKALFLEDEFKPSVDWVEKIGMALYCGNTPDDDIDPTFECFLENGYLNDYLFEDEDEDEQDGQQQDKEFDPLDFSIYSKIKSKYVG